MQIKGMNGESYNVTGQGQGNYNTVGASAGIASFLGLNAGNLFGGLGNGWRNGMNGPVEVITSEDKPISRYEAKMMQDLSTKDAEISLLKAVEKLKDSDDGFRVRKYFKRKMYNDSPM